MTLHSAKGLEFDAVFLVGLEEGLFPHSLVFQERQRYRGGKEALLCGPHSCAPQVVSDLDALSPDIRVGRERARPQPSRFLKEMPPELLEGSGSIAELCG